MFVIQEVLKTCNFKQVFADHDSSHEPLSVPREWIWNLPRRTVYFGTSVPSIFKGKKALSIKLLYNISNN